MARPLRVVMPALTYVPGAMGGSETYARALVAALDARDDVDLTVIVSRSAAGALGASSEHVVASVVGGPSTLFRLAAVASGLLGDRTARSLMRSADVVHYPFTVPVPLPPDGVRWVTTLLDVQHRDLPEMFSPAERVYRAVAYDAGSRRAARVVTISEFCRDRIHANLCVPTKRIDVAHLGVDLEKFSFGAGPRGAFVFYPAAAWPHKNHARLVEAVDLARRRRPDLRLVLTGAGRERLANLPDWVEHRGMVGATEVIDLYRTAAVMAFPSLYEGFGLPLLEAMSAGCRVAAAASGAVPEVCGDAAVLFDGEDVGAIARGIETALDAGDRLVEAGVERARRFTWSATAEAHIRSFVAAGGLPAGA